MKRDQSTIWKNKIVYKYYYREDNVVNIRREKPSKTNTIIEKKLGGDNVHERYGRGS
jgi:hypothetical protein